MSQLSKNINDELKRLRSLDKTRQYGKTNLDNERPWSSECQRDCARILYSTSFRRLQGKTQMFGINPPDFYRNRLTHSLEVSQIARSICLKLDEKYEDNSKLWQLDDLFLVEAISLAHDMGNPPFGHAGEYVLDEIAAGFDGFEGNAQTLRIVTSLETKYPHIPGLNLTWRTLLGLVKYFERRKREGILSGKFLYKDEYKLIKDIREKEKINGKTIDCQIMEIADDIANAAHDLEDSLRQKYINADDIIYLFECEEAKNKEKCQKNGKKSIDLIKEVVERAKATARDCRTQPLSYYSSDPYESLLRKEITSRLVDRLVNDIWCKTDKDNKLTIEFSNHRQFVKSLKKFEFESTKNVTESILKYEKVGEKVLRGLYEVFIDNKFNKDNELLGSVYRGNGNLDDDQKKRFVIDYIAGMTDSFAIEQYINYFGNDPFQEGFYTGYQRNKQVTREYRAPNLID